MTIEQEAGAARTLRSSGTEPARWQVAAAGLSVAQWVAAAVSLLIGVTLILNIYPVGDGMWFWYAVYLRRGVHLYRDLHLALQPLYVLLTAAFQVVLGTGWIPSKAFPLLQLLTLIALLTGLARFIPWAPWQRALLSLFAFLFILQPSTYRFDDYHVTSDVFTLGSLLLLLHLGSRPRTTRAVAWFAFAMGLCCGMAAMTRLNDGAALVVAVGLVLLLLYTRQAVASLAAVAVGTLLAMGLTLLAVREGPGTWWHYSITAAGAIKGGTGNILFTPLLLPWHLFINMLSWKLPLAVALLAGLMLAVHGVQARLRRHAGWQGYAFIWTAVLLALAFPLVHRSQVQTPLELLVRLAILLLLLVAVGMTVWCVVRAAQGRPVLRQPAYALLLLPLMHLLGGALTASNALPDPYLSLAMLLLVGPLLLPPRRVEPWVLPALTGLALVAAIIATGKAQHPYYWWTYDDGAVYRNRAWYRHPEFGPMYIEQGQLALMASFCARIDAGAAAGAPASLLSMPFPYANYFCNVPPWHEYVQTWYDTSSAATIHALVQQLETAPPRWIAYEYDPVAVIGHEITYHHGKPIAHRALMGLVVQNIESGKWTLREQGCSRMSEWLLVETVRVPEAENTLRSGFDPKGTLCK